MPASEGGSTGESETLTAQLVKELAQILASRNLALPERYLRAFRRVPRHHFLLPELQSGAVSLADVYSAGKVVPIKRDAARDAVTSSSSAPDTMATMLVDLDVDVGHHVLEIGTGSGYNAALLKCIVGEAGSVVSVEIQPDVARRAREALRPYDVTVVVADAAELELDRRFDRIVVTAAVQDLHPVWLRSLADGGRCVAPVNWLGIWSPTLVTDRSGPRWLSRFGRGIYSFMPLTGQSGSSLLMPVVQSATWSLRKVPFYQSSPAVRRLTGSLSDRYGFAFFGLLERDPIVSIQFPGGRWEFGVGDATHFAAITPMGLVYTSDAACRTLQRIIARWSESGAPSLQQFELVVGGTSGRWQWKPQHNEYWVDA